MGGHHFAHVWFTVRSDRVPWRLISHQRIKFPLRPAIGTLRSDTPQIDDHRIGFACSFFKMWEKHPWEDTPKLIHKLPKITSTVYNNNNNNNYYYYNYYYHYYYIYTLNDGDHDFNIGFPWCSCCNSRPDVQGLAGIFQGQLTDALKLAVKAGPGWFNEEQMGLIWLKCWYMIYKW